MTGLSMTRQVSVLVVAGATALVADAVLAQSSSVIAPFSSDSLNREIHGNAHRVDLSAGGHPLGDATTFFGLDALSNNNRQYLTSGVQWDSAATDAPLIQVAALHTEARGDAYGGQTLMRAESRLDLGQRWFLPALTTEVDQVSTTGDLDAGSHAGGRAAHVGLAKAVGSAQYNIGYFSADPQYDALGSAITPGDRGLELGSRYGLADGLQLSSNLRWHQPAAVWHPYAGFVEQWSIQPDQTAAASTLGSPWHIDAQLGNAVMASAATPAATTPIALDVAAATRTWRDWHIDSSVGWYTPGMPTTTGLPVDGGLWRMAARHRVSIAGVATDISPTLSIGGSHLAGTRLASRTGLNFGFPGLDDRLNLGVNYLSAGWGPDSGSADIQLSLNYTQNAASLFSGVSNAFGRLRSPWRRDF